MHTSATGAAAPANAEHDHGLAHVMPPSMLLGVFTALIALTLLTVSAANWGLGAWDIWFAMGVATIKAGLVAVYFMHLRYDKPINCLIFLFTLGFFALFLALILMDARQYQPDVRSWETQQQSM